MTEWLTLRIRNRAKEKIKYPDKDKPVDLLYVANCIYDGLVEDWMYNSNILAACRALKCDRAKIVEIISDMFDEDGKPIPIKKDENMGYAEPKSAESPTYYASMSTIEEEYALKKADRLNLRDGSCATPGQKIRSKGKGKGLGRGKGKGPIGIPAK